MAGSGDVRIEGDFDAAVLSIDRSLSLNSNSTRARIANGMIRCCIGEPETAIEHANRAIRLSPFDIAMWVVHGVWATADMHLADYEAAAASAKASTGTSTNSAARIAIIAPDYHLPRPDNALESRS